MPNGLRSGEGPDPKSPGGGERMQCTRLSWLCAGVWSTACLYFLLFFLVLLFAPYFLSASPFIIQGEQVYKG
jgi:hypothetical protein